MSTIKEVAALANVSIATVSNYLNHTKPVSKDVSTRIQQAVEQLNYSQNQNARNLKTRQNTEIGVILPSLNDPYYVQIFQGIKSYFQNTAYDLNLCFSENIPEFEISIVRKLMKKQLCGLFLMTCQPDNWKFFYEHVTSKKIPIVLIDRNIHGLDANFITFNNRVLLRDMTEALLKSNYEKICLMSGPQNFSCESECQRGFCDAFHNEGLSSEQYDLVYTDMSKEDAFRKTIKYLKHHMPDAIVTTSESSTSGIIEGLTILGYNTDDIPVFTLGEEHWNLHTHSFSSALTVRPAMKLGRTAARLLSEQLRSPLTKETEKIILNGRKFHHNILEFSHTTESLEKRTPKTKDLHNENSNEKIRLLLLDTPQVHYTLRLIRNFEIKYGIKTDVTILPHHRLYETILEAHNNHSNISYDVFMYDIPWMMSLAYEHILEDITIQMKEINPNIFLPDCLKYYSCFDEHYYGVPFIYAPQILYYRKDLFENPTLQSDYEKLNNISLRPPVTLKEYNTIADFFTNKTDAINYGISVPTAYSECLTPEIYMRLRAFGGSIFTQSGKVCLDSDQALKAYINFMRSVKYAKPDYREATDYSAVNDFLSGETAMLISYPPFLEDISDLRKNSITGSIGYHLIPGRSPLLGGWSLGISSHSKHKENAFKLLKWTCDHQISNYTTLLGGLSTLNSTYTNDELAGLYPWLPLYHEIYKYSKPTIPPRLSDKTIFPQYEIDEVVCKWIYKMLDHELNVQETITNTHLELDSLVHSRTSKK